MINKKIPSLSISISNICSLRCVYCPPYGEDLTKCAEVCPIETINNLLNAAKRYGFNFIRFTGGEPLETPRRLKSALENTVMLGFPIIKIDTNGRLLEKAIPWLIKFKNNVECKVSIDTLDNSSYKEITGVNCLNDVINGVKIANALGIKIVINTVITKINRGNYLNVLEFCNKNCLNMKIFDMYNYGGKITERWNDNFTSIEHIITDLSKKYKAIASQKLATGLGLEMHIFELSGGRTIQVVRHHDEKKRNINYVDTCKNCKSYPCSTGRFHVFMRSDGMVMPCRLRADLGVNINDKSINELINILHEMAGQVVE